MKIEVGKTYITRSGTEVQIIGYDEKSEDECRYRALLKSNNWNYGDDFDGYNENGKYWGDDVEDEDDLVAELSELTKLLFL